MRHEDALAVEEAETMRRFMGIKLRLTPTDSPDRFQAELDVIQAETDLHCAQIGQLAGEVQH